MSAFDPKRTSGETLCCSARGHFSLQLGFEPFNRHRVPYLECGQIISHFERPRIGLLVSAVRSAIVGSAIFSLLEKHDMSIDAELWFCLSENPADVLRRSVMIDDALHEDISHTTPGVPSNFVY